ncbi:hypothetical protein BV898_09552 [Hypsibius exemplaris]|uniref:Uncharacterized protein n=1 Tax=Hypsibius exemplaris TaxID=2072580 RepID=A0A1W0WM95_HYPEX|nr:hypothetical protein BV898_09552 [Hypsibius exemplaris]
MSWTTTRWPAAALLGLVLIHFPISSTSRRTTTTSINNLFFDFDEDPGVVVVTAGPRHYSYRYHEDDDGEEQEQEQDAHHDGGSSLTGSADQSDPEAPSNEPQLFADHTAINAKVTADKASHYHSPHAERHLTSNDPAGADRRSPFSDGSGGGSNTAAGGSGVVRFSRVRHFVLQQLQQQQNSRRETQPGHASPTQSPAFHDDEEDNETMRSTAPTWQGNSYIPYRYRCQSSKYCRPGPVQPPVPVPRDAKVTRASGCALLRWNYELPFTEMPNLVFSFLATDMISGPSIQVKSRFLASLLHTGLNAFMNSNSSSLVFTIPEEVDTAYCKIKRSVEPAIKSLYQMLNIYTSRDHKSLLTLVHAAKCCLDQRDQKDPFPMELLPCLDFSFGSEELLNLTQPRSLFGNPELCRRYLRYNISNCLPARPHSCNEKHLLTLNIFAQRFYMCAGSLPFSMSNQTIQNPLDYEDEIAYARVSTATGPNRRKDLIFRNAFPFFTVLYTAFLLRQY